MSAHENVFHVKDHQVYELQRRLFNDRDRLMRFNDEWRSRRVQTGETRQEAICAVRDQWLKREQRKVCNCLADYSSK